MCGDSPNSFLEAESSEKRADVVESNIGELGAIENAVEQPLMPIHGERPRRQGKRWLPGQDLNPQPSG